MSNPLYDLVYGMFKEAQGGYTPEKKRMPAVPGFDDESKEPPSTKPQKETAIISKPKAPRTIITPDEKAKENRRLYLTLRNQIEGMSPGERSRELLKKYIDKGLTRTQIEEIISGSERALGSGDRKALNQIVADIFSPKIKEQPEESRPTRPSQLPSIPPDPTPPIPPDPIPPDIQFPISEEPPIKHTPPPQISEEGVLPRMADFADLQKGVKEPEAPEEPEKKPRSKAPPDVFKFTPVAPAPELQQELTARLENMARVYAGPKTKRILEELAGKGLTPDQFENIVAGSNLTEEEKDRINRLGFEAGLKPSAIGDIVTEPITPPLPGEETIEDIVTEPIAPPLPGEEAITLPLPREEAIEDIVTEPIAPPLPGEAEEIKQRRSIMEEWRKEEKELEESISTEEVSSTEKMQASHENTQILWQLNPEQNAYKKLTGSERQSLAINFKNNCELLAKTGDKKTLSDELSLGMATVSKLTKTSPVLAERMHDDISKLINENFTEEELEAKFFDENNKDVQKFLAGVFLRKQGIDKDYRDIGDVVEFDTTKEEKGRRSRSEIIEEAKKAKGKYEAGGGKTLPLNYYVKNLWAEEQKKNKATGTELTMKYKKLKESIVQRNSITKVTMYNGETLDDVLGRFKAEHGGSIRVIRRGNSAFIINKNNFQNSVPKSEIDQVLEETGLEKRHPWYYARYDKDINKMCNKIKKEKIVTFSYDKLKELMGEDVPNYYLFNKMKKILGDDYTLQTNSNNITFINNKAFNQSMGLFNYLEDMSDFNNTEKANTAYKELIGWAYEEKMLPRDVAEDFRDRLPTEENKKALELAIKNDVGETGVINQYKNIREHTADKARFGPYPSVSFTSEGWRTHYQKGGIVKNSKDAVGKHIVVPTSIYVMPIIRAGAVLANKIHEEGSEVEYDPETENLTIRLGDNIELGIKQTKKRREEIPEEAARMAPYPTPGKAHYKLRYKGPNEIFFGPIFSEYGKVKFEFMDRTGTVLDHYSRITKQKNPQSTLDRLMHKFTNLVRSENVAMGREGPSETIQGINHILVKILNSKKKNDISSTAKGSFNFLRKDYPETQQNVGSLIFSQKEIEGCVELSSLDKPYNEIRYEAMQDLITDEEIYEKLSRVDIKLQLKFEKYLKDHPGSYAHVSDFMRTLTASDKNTFLNFLYSSEIQEAYQNKLGNRIGRAKGGPIGWAFAKTFMPESAGEAFKAGKTMTTLEETANTGNEKAEQVRKMFQEIAVEPVKNAFEELKKLAVIAQARLPEIKTEFSKGLNEAENMIGGMQTELDGAFKALDKLEPGKGEEYRASLEKLRLKVKEYDKKLSDKNELKSNERYQRLLGLVERAKKFEKIDLGAFERGEAEPGPAMDEIKYLLFDLNMELKSTREELLPTARTTADKVHNFAVKIADEIEGKQRKVNAYKGWTKAAPWIMTIITALLSMMFLPKLFGGAALKRPGAGAPGRYEPKDVYYGGGGRF